MTDKFVKDLISQIVHGLNELPDTFDVIKIDETRIKVTFIDPIMVDENYDKDEDPTYVVEFNIRKEA